MTERVALTFDPPERLASVANLVAGGVAGRFGLSVERVGELQLALTTVLESIDGDGPVTVEFEVSDRLECLVGPIGDDPDSVLPVVSRLAGEASLVSREDGRWLAIVVSDVVPRTGG